MHEVTRARQAKSCDPHARRDARREASGALRVLTVFDAIWAIVDRLFTEEEHARATRDKSREFASVETLAIDARKVFPGLAFVHPSKGLAVTHQLNEVLHVLPQIDRIRRPASVFDRLTVRRDRTRFRITG